MCDASDLTPEGAWIVTSEPVQLKLDRWRIFRDLSVLSCVYGRKVQTFFFRSFRSPNFGVNLFL